MNSKELEKLALLKVAKRMIELTEETAREQETTIARFASEGTLQSRDAIKAIMNLALRRMDGIIRAQYEAFKEVCTAAGLLNNALLREYGQIQALHYANRPILQAIDASPVMSGLKRDDILEKMVCSEIERLKVSFLSDVQIDAGNIRAIHDAVTTTAPSRKKWDIFVSFATVDQVVADIVMVRLRENGLRVFSSPKDLQRDDKWSEVLRVVLITSAELWLILSKASLKREWVLTEWGAAWATAKKMTTVLVDLEVKDLPVRLQSKQCIGVQDLTSYALHTAERILGKRQTV